MLMAHLMKLLPQASIFNRLAGRIDPSFANPALYPFGHTLHQVLRVCSQRHFAGLLQMVQGDNSCCQLHNIVGRFFDGTLQFLGFSFVSNDASISSRARISPASPIGKYFNLFHERDEISTFMIDRDYQIRPRSCPQIFAHQYYNIFFLLNKISWDLFV